ncbi:MAG: TonB-dependent receptor [Candidatus Aminicenantes bacterium]|nr:TonB-dependent receptor [Candidatus Aminicenantes bacterium]
MKNILKLPIILLLAFGLAVFSFSQGRQTGTISGIVADEEGNPLPGATVIISSPSLLGQRLYITSATGKFRFPALLPGEYEVRVEMPGFKTVVRKGLLCSVGKTTECRICLTISAIEEEIEVVAESPVVDVGTSKVSVNYSSDFIASIPMNRDLYDIQNSIPGAISDGAECRRTSSILGGTVRSTLYALDGVPMNDPATFYSMANINVDVYEEVEFGVGALPAEVGQTDSVYVNIVTKSGGNKFTGGATFYYTGESFAEDLLSLEDIDALGVDKPEKFSGYKDASLNLGGPILEDRVWFFLNGRRLIWDKVNPYTPENRLEKVGFTSPHYDLTHEEWLGFVKLTFQISNNIKYMGMLHYNHIYEPVYTNRVATSYSHDYTGVWDHENTYTTTHQLNWVLNQNTFVDVRGTYIHRYFPIISRPGTEGNYTYYDRTQVVYWGTTSYNDEYIRKKMLGSASITNFLDDFLGASHEIKAGVEVEQTEYHRDWYRANPYYAYWRDYSAGNPYYYSTSEKKGRLRIRYCPPVKGMWDVQDHTRRFSGYLQDSLSAGRLAVNLGLRLDYSFQYEPQQMRPELRYNYGPELLAPDLAPNSLLEALINQWHEEIGPYSPFDALTTPYKKPVEFFTISPRIGIVYDLFGDGKTALKFSFSRYYEPVWSAKYNAAQIFGAGYINYYWYDYNGNKLMDLPPTDGYKLESYPEQDPEYSYYVDDLKPPYMHEFIAGVEHELIRDFKLGLQFIWKENKNIVEDIDINNGYDPTATDEKGLIWLPYEVADPGMDGEFGTSDDQLLTVYGLREDRPIKTWMGTNPPEAKRRYWAVILTFDKRMSNKWQLKGSVLYSAFKGNASAGYSATEGESSMFDNPNTLTNAYGRLYFDRPLQVRLMGTVILPYDFILSAYFQHHSGSPWTRTLSRVYFPSDLPVQESYVSVNAEPLGSRRNAPSTNLDLRVEKSFSLSNFGKLNVYVDIFNVGGRSGVNIYQNPNGWLYYYKSPPEYQLDSLYGTVSSVYGVRSFRLGVRWSF